MGSRQDLRLSPWARNGFTGMLSSLFIRDTPKDMCRDLDEGQNPTTTDAPSASSFLESLSGKEGSGLLLSFGVTVHGVVGASSYTSWENNWRILEGKQLALGSGLKGCQDLSSG